MIVREFYKTRNDGVKLYRTYSDQNYKICNVKDHTKIYDDAIDIENSKNLYVETDIPITLPYIEIPE